LSAGARHRRSSTTSAPTESDPVYVDASAFVKLVLEEPESEALEAYMSRLAEPPISNLLLRIEAIRAVRIGTQSSAAVREIQAALAGVTLVAFDDATFRRAETIEPIGLRALDAIHLATALHLGAREMVVYDQRLANAARDHGLDVTSPGA
jgi:predicted nucleic acid-binding protein